MIVKTAFEHSVSLEEVAEIYRRLNEKCDEVLERIKRRKDDRTKKR